MQSDGVLEIRGNREGLIFLSKCLFGLAHSKADPEYHVHLDSLYEINASDHEFILRKIDTDNL
jgi:hypothetical protein